MLGAVIQTLTYAVQAVAGMYSIGFPFLVAGYAFAGFSLAIQVRIVETPDNRDTRSSASVAHSRTPKGADLSGA